MSHIHLLEPAALVQEPSRILRMNGERDPRVPRAGGAGERFAQERLAVALVLELGLKRYAQLRVTASTDASPVPWGSTRIQQAPASTPSTTATMPQSVSRPQSST